MQQQQLRWPLQSQQFPIRPCFHLRRLHQKLQQNTSQTHFQQPSVGRNAGLFSCKSGQQSTENDNDGLQVHAAKELAPAYFFGGIEFLVGSENSYQLLNLLRVCVDTLQSFLAALACSDLIKIFRSVVRIDKEKDYGLNHHYDNREGQHELPVVVLTEINISVFTGKTRSHHICKQEAGSEKNNVACTKLSGYFHGAQLTNYKFVNDRNKKY
eukprot:TRINITY_DN64332_c1_g1_i1.p3 TRINITY_DN64332_c1_g1~~TRINITY_DN64332_c1_g1_i1.p3  ORF type:complete len:212 (-),score=2.25 TRINITY_DN64332_c1_g1_i1:772-1407(-)